jgi:rubrerythrin
VSKVSSFTRTNTSDFINESKVKEEFFNNYNKDKISKKKNAETAEFLNELFLSEKNHCEVYSNALETSMDLHDSLKGEFLTFCLLLGIEVIQSCNTLLRSKSSLPHEFIAADSLKFMRQFVIPKLLSFFNYTIAL